MLLRILVVIVPCLLLADFAPDADASKDSRRARPAQASLFVDSSGSDTNPCTAGAPCATFNRAYQLASRGETVEVAAGVYGPQTIFAAQKTGSSYVVFQPPPGSRVTTGELRINGARGVEFRNMTIGDYYVANGSDSVVFRNDDTLVFFIRSASNVSIIGGRVGGTTHAESATIGSTAGSTVPSRNIVIDGVEFHDMTRVDAPADHPECLFIQSVDGFVLRNSRFHGCDVFDFYDSNILVGPVSTNLLIENNFLGTATAGGFYSMFFRNDPGETQGNIVVRNNSLQQGLHFDAGAYENTRVTANVGPLRQYQCTAGVTYAYNVWDNAQCGPTDRKAPLGFRDAASLDLHLVPGAPALGHGDPDSHPALDIDGDMRPRTVAPDAGADQRETAAIVVGHSIGAVRIGMTRADVIGFYGKARRSIWRRFAPDRLRVQIALYRLHGGRFSVVYDGDTVVGVAAWSPYYSTAAGGGPGSTADGVRRFALVTKTTCGDVYHRVARGVDTYFTSSRDATIGGVLMLRLAYGPYCKPRTS